MFQDLTAVVSAELWPHQRDAIEFALERLRAGDTPCLIRMPTGTGKTGVIACLTQLSCPGSSLVLTPWANLRDQIIVDVQQRFWARRKIVINARKVVDLKPSNASKVLDEKEDMILVATFAALNDIRRESPDVFVQLSRKLALVVVDEGHYEPAIEWGKSVKQLGTPTVLLTATPYRNDLKYFRIKDPDKSTKHFTHREAEEKKIIRPVAFKSLPPASGIPALSAAFVSEWKQVLRDKRLPSSAARAIICCEDDESIAVCVKTLRNFGLDAIGVHEQFQYRSEPFLRQAVPKPEDEKAPIWVHQRKLMEGLDDNRFCCLALFTPMRNDRKLVQQIGRILRVGDADRNTPALVLAPQGYDTAERWSAYRSFETDHSILKPDHFKKVVEAMLDRQPEVEYFDGRFRRKFSPSTTAGALSVIIPPSVLVRGTSNNFSLASYIEDCTDTLNLSDSVILGPVPDQPVVSGSDHALWVYATVGNSRLLSDTSLYEMRLETHCVVQTDGMLFIADSAGNLPHAYLSDQTFRLSSSKLGRFIDDRFRPTHVGVNSVVPYETVVRSADLSGQNLLSAATSLTDRMHICRSVRGVAVSEGRRYVGMGNGRLRKEVNAEDRRRFDLATFRTWAIEVAGVLRSHRTANPLFGRYMSTCEPPTVVSPRTLCIDLGRTNIDLTTEDGREVWLRNSSGDVMMANPDDLRCKFRLEPKVASASSDELVLSLAYDHKKRRFHFRQMEGTRVNVGAEDGNSTKEKSLAEFLDQNQDTVLIGLSGGEIVYQGGQFFKVDYSYAEKALLGLVSRPGKVPPCSTEKGDKEQIALLKKTTSKFFPANSLFRAIATSKELIPFEPELLICDDLGTECADFVAVNFTRKQFALIHAKTGSGAQVSASAFHDVVAQAMKNMVYFTRSADKPPGLSNWKRTARWNRTQVPRLLRVTNGAPTTGTSIWRRIMDDILTSSSPELYVVLATAGCLESAALTRAISDPSARTPETAQLVHLLDSLNGHARQLGVKLKVYDVPFKAPVKKTKP